MPHFHRHQLAAAKLPLVNLTSESVNPPLRHPFALRLLARGVTVATVAQLMQHARRTSR